MRRLTAFLLTLAALVPSPSAAAATRGRIVGRVVDAATGEPVAGVKVTLTGAHEDGTDRVRTVARTDARGRYVFAGLETGAELVYAVDARHDGGLFAGRAISLPADTEQAPMIDTTLRVWETTTDPTAILIRRDVIFAVPGDDGLGIIESVTIANTSQRAYIGRGGPNARGSIGFALPSDAADEGVTILDSTYDIPDIVRTEFGFAATIAVPPGETKVTFTYPLGGSAGTFDLSRTALYPILDLEVLVGDPLRIESNRLVSRDEETIGGRRYRRWAAEGNIDAGDPVQVNAVAEAGAGPLLLGAVVAVATVLAASVLLLLRRRRSPVPAEPARAPAPGDLMEAIAALDLRYRAGEIGEEEWTRTRAELKRRIRRPRAPEPTK
ncbi:MAG: carboxypeptidase-like regulatory domain-containing protein [Actinomycetota bacterium]